MEATNISNAFFAEGNANATLAALAAQRDGVLVSDETVKDFQLFTGDLINLRLQNLTDHQYHVVPFHLVGIVREFPTAPKDSFLIANAAYIAEQTGTQASRSIDSAAEMVLVKAGDDPVKVAERVRAVTSDLVGVKVTEIGSAQRAISSSLTAVDLRGLTGLELAFALLMLLGATGLVLGLGLTERIKDEFFRQSLYSKHSRGSRGSRSHSN